MFVEDASSLNSCKYETKKKNHQKLKGKILVVMAFNFGFDVAGGQFDVMIPGGGWSWSLQRMSSNFWNW